MCACCLCLRWCLALLELGVAGAFWLGSMQIFQLSPHCPRCQVTGVPQGGSLWETQASKSPKLRRGKRGADRWQQQLSR